MSAEDLQAFNLSINGCVRRFVSVFFSYFFREASKTACKSEEEEFDGVGVVLDMPGYSRAGV